MTHADKTRPRRRAHLKDVFFYGLPLLFQAFSVSYDFWPLVTGVQFPAWILQFARECAAREGIHRLCERHCMMGFAPLFVSPMFNSSLRCRIQPLVSEPMCIAHILYSGLLAQFWLARRRLRLS